MAPKAPSSAVARLSADLAKPVVATALAAARRAGQIQLRDFRNAPAECTRLLHDVKTRTDRDCEEAIVETIRESFPDHAILTEERGELPGDGACRWVIDPLDGTVNFWHGLPFFCVSIACFLNGDDAPEGGAEKAGPQSRPLAGVVFMPCSDEMFVGVAGRGASLNQQPIRTCQVTDTREAVVSLSFGKTPAVMDCMTRRLAALLPQVRKGRCLGAAAAELAYAAAGFLGGVIYEGIKQWDFAAGKILLEEAGGCLEAVETQPDQWRVLAVAPEILAALRPLLSI
jgi:fructose-1,6-bisphosphatase/inositol monophosphatase family enzyme